MLRCGGRVGCAMCDCQLFGRVELGIGHLAADDVAQQIGIRVALCDGQRQPKMRAGEIDLDPPTLGIDEAHRILGVHLSALRGFANACDLRRVVAQQDQVLEVVVVGHAVDSDSWVQDPHEYRAAFRPRVRPRPARLDFARLGSAGRAAVRHVGFGRGAIRADTIGARTPTFRTPSIQSRRHRR